MWHTMCSRTAQNHVPGSAPACRLSSLVNMNPHHFGGAQLAVRVLQHVAHHVAADAIVRAVGQAPLQQRERPHITHTALTKALGTAAQPGQEQLGRRTHGLQKAAAHASAHRGDAGVQLHGRRHRQAVHLRNIYPLDLLWQRGDVLHLWAAAGVRDGRCGSLTLLDAGCAYV